MNVAYSVDAFELWLCLHYEYVTSIRGRAHYYELLSKRWSMNYAAEGKKLRFCLGLREKLENDPEASRDNAIHYAKKLLARYHSDERISEHGPVTTVFRLVEALLSAGHH